MILYHYRAIGGTEIPGIHHGDNASLVESFRDSATPIVRMVAIDTDATRREWLAVLSDRLNSTPVSRIGLRRSLTDAIADLSR